MTQIGGTGYGNTGGNIPDFVRHFPRGVDSSSHSVRVPIKYEPEPAINVLVRIKMNERTVDTVVGDVNSDSIEGVVFGESGKRLITYAWTLKNDEELVDVAKDKLLDLVKDKGYSEKDLSAVELVVKEALINCSKHAYPVGEDYCPIELGCIFDGDGLTVIVEDNGTGFNPNDVPDPIAPENLEKPGGRGLFLMKNLMDGVYIYDKSKYSRYDSSGTMVIMRRNKTSE